MASLKVSTEMRETWPSKNLNNFTCLMNEVQWLLMPDFNSFLRVSEVASKGLCANYCRSDFEFSEFHRLVAKLFSYTVLHDSK